MLINAIDSVNLDDKGRQPKMNPLKMGDTIVLELASPKKSRFDVFILYFVNKSASRFKLFNMMAGTKCHSPKD